MLLKALLAFLALPGTLAILVPLLLARLGGAAHPPSALGVFILLPGLATLFWCVREFYVAGHGTLAPWAPPERLVTTGPYRLSRNPMYLAVLLMLAGWALAFRLASLWIYTALVAIAFHLRVVVHEEPWLERRHGDAWRSYRTRVRRWL